MNVNEGKYTIIVWDALPRDWREGPGVLACIPEETLARVSVGMHAWVSRETLARVSFPYAMRSSSLCSYGRFDISFG